MDGNHWNGIVTEEKAKKMTIDDKLKRYSYAHCITVIATSLLVFLVIFVYMGIYDQMLGGVYSLEELGGDLGQLHTAGTEILSSEKENREEEISLLLEKIRGDIGELWKLNIEGNFLRNLDDLSRLIDQYETIQGNILKRDAARRENGRTQAEMEESLENYQTMEEIYLAAVERERILHEELSAHLNRQKGEMRQKFILFLGAVLCTVVSGFLLLWVSARQIGQEISRPIRNLTHMAKQITQGDLDRIVPKGQEMEESSVMETEVLSAAFTVMLQRIQEQVLKLKENMAVREQLKEQELENLRMANLLATSQFQCLQMQMNPHFLFNTLNMIQQTVYLDRKEKTSFLLEETAAFLRYSLDYVGKNVPLRVELEALGNYISLQEERLGERILFEFELDESINEVRVPSLILQPLVENSLIHGVADKRSDALILISTRYLEEEQIAWICIEDNGHGISAEKIAILQKSMRESEIAPEKGIGLVNVYRRLQILTENRVEMKLESEPEKGTRVTIHIPYVRGEEGGRKDESS